MDPKNAQILDPKLKEAYDRVMGASVPSSTSNPPPPMPPPAHTPPPAAPPAAQTPHDPLDHMMTPPSHAAPTPPPPPPLHPMGMPAAAPAHPAAATPPAPANPAPAQPGQPPHATMSFSSGYVAPHPASKSPVSGKLLIVAGVIFLIVYTLFWMKWFGMAIPFLP